jgi:hypothetical protein
MPIFTFKCENGHSFDELFWQSEPAPDEMDCVRGCAAKAKRYHAYRFRIIGPVFEHVEKMEGVLFSDKQRREGARLRGAKDIARVEAEQGIHREDDTFYRVARDEMRHEEWQIKEVQREQGVEKALDYVDDMRIKEATGWDNKEVQSWKDQINDLEKSGYEPPSLADVVANSGGPSPDVGD